MNQGFEMATTNEANRLWLAGEQAAERKQTGEAEALFRRALGLVPGHAASLIGLSSVLGRRGAHREAHAAVLQAFAAHPTEPPLVYALAQRLRYFHEFDRLLSCLATPAFADEAPPEIIAKASVMLSSIGAHTQATDMAEAAVRRDPRCAAAQHALGNYHQFRGDYDAAEICHEASLQADPTLFQNSLMLAGARTQTPERNHVERLQAQLLRAKPRGTGEVYLCFALHKELHDLGRHDEAWVALDRGCQAKRRQLNYQSESSERLVSTLISTCTSDFVSAASEVPQPATPIFIVGMHRSGTTLLERMLSGHSQIADAGETSTFRAALELAVDTAAPAGPDAAFVQRVADADFDAVARGYAERTHWLSRGKPLFTEKLPQNFLNVGLIAKAMPQARFLHLVRDPMDTCFSNLRTLFLQAALYSYEQTELGQFYLQYQRMMAHWRQVLPGRVLDIVYDELVADPEAVAARVATHCGVAFEPGMIDIGRSSGSVATPSAALARQGFRRDRGRAWAPYERYLGPLRAALQPAYA